MEKSGSKWQYRDEYLSSVSQKEGETMAELDPCIKTLVSKFMFKLEKM